MPTSNQTALLLLLLKSWYRRRGCLPRPFAFLAPKEHFLILASQDVFALGGHFLLDNIESA